MVSPRFVLLSNADKRHRVEVAIAKFPEESSRKLADICGVSDPFVLKIKSRVEVLTVSTWLDASNQDHQQKTPTVIGKDGKSYPATIGKAKPEPETEQETDHWEAKPTPVNEPVIVTENEPSNDPQTLPLFPQKRGHVVWDEERAVIDSIPGTAGQPRPG